MGMLRGHLSTLQVAGFHIVLICVLGSLFGNFTWGMATLGPAFLWAWIVGGLLQISVAIAMSMLSATYPVTGGCYRWLRALGYDRLARFIGYLLLVGYVAAIADDDSGLANSLLSFAAVHNPGTGILVATMLACLLAQTFLSLLAISRVARVTLVAAIVQVALIVAIAVALLVAGLRQHAAILLHVAGTTEHEHMPPFLLMLMIPAWTLTGFDTPVNFAGDANDPSRTIPRALLLATGLSFVLGTALIVVPLLAMPGPLAAGMPATIPFILAARLGMGFSQLSNGVELLALFALPVVVQLVAARMLWAQVSDGAWLGGRILATYDARQVPVRATVLCAAAAALLCLGWPMVSALGTVWPALWALSYGITIAAGLIARMQDGRRLGVAWNPGRLGAANALLAAVWCSFLAALLPLFDALHAIPLLIAVVVIGLLASRAGGRIQTAGSAR